MDCEAEIQCRTGVYALPGSGSRQMMIIMPPKIYS